MFWRIRRLKRRIQNLFHWLPTVWRDEQWDQSYLYKIIEQKLRLMEKYFSSDEVMNVNAKKDAKRIRVCRILCKRLREWDYETSWDEKNGFVLDRIFNMEDLIEGRRTTIGETTIREDFFLNLAIEHEENMRKQDKELLFNYMKKYIDGWWE